MECIALTNDIVAQTQGRNIRHYANYLTERARGYRDTGTDWVRANEGKVERSTVDKGLLRQTESVQNQISALIKCDVSRTSSVDTINCTNALQLGSRERT